MFERPANQMGLEIEMNNNDIVIKSVGKEAHDLGLREGQVILEINGQDITNRSFRDILSTLYSPQYNQIMLGIKS